MPFRMVSYRHRSLYSRSVPIFRTNLWRYARRITMAMTIVVPPPIWCIPTPSDNAQCFVLILKDSSGDLVYSVHCSVWYLCHIFHAVFGVHHTHEITITELNALHVVYYFSFSVYKCIYFHNRMLLKLFTKFRDTPTGLSRKMIAINKEYHFWHSLN